MSNEEIGRAAAVEFRQRHAMGDEPIADMARLIERTTGVGVAFVGVPAPGHGMTMARGEDHLIAVGCTEHPMRLRSTLAHELGHLVLGTVDREVHGVNWDERTPEEIQADAFARHLLVPMTGVSRVVEGREATLAMLSDLVQAFLASPSLVAIQVRDSGAVDQTTFQHWRTMAAGTLAARFGWHSQYQSLVTQSRRPRAPQALLARAIEGYRWGLVSPAVIARLDGKPNPRSVVASLAEDGIVVQEFPDATASPPKVIGQPLTPEELRMLSGGDD